MPTVKLIEEGEAALRVQAIYADIKATKKIDRVPNFWRALASNPDNLERGWHQAKAVMKPGKLDCSPRRSSPWPSRSPIVAAIASTRTRRPAKSSA